MLRGQSNKDKFTTPAILQPKQGIFHTMKHVRFQVDPLLAGI